MFKNLFHLDLRSLGLARIFLGLITFFDIGRRIDEIDVFYSDSGILSRAELIQNFELNWRMTLLNLNGSVAFATIVAIAGVMASLTYMLGWKTRVSNFIVWIVIISFQARFPEAATAGGDMLLRIFLFWSLFLPMNACFSIDGMLSKEQLQSYKYQSVFTTLWTMQIFILYFFTFLYKWTPVYHSKFEAVWYMLQLEIFTTPLGQLIGQYYELTRVLSFTFYGLEIVGPIMLLIPWKRDLWRGLAVTFFWIFHVGIGLTLHLGNFVPVCLTIWVALIPAAWWKKIWKTNFNFQLQRLGEAGSISIAGKLPIILHTKESMGAKLRLALGKIKFSDPIKYKLNRLEIAFGTSLLILIMAWNIEGYIKNRKWYIGTPFDEVMFALHLNQGWAMFAPHPQRSDGWWVMDGVLKDGTKWDVLNNKDVSFNRPASFYETYKTENWRKFLDNLQGNRSDAYLLALGRHLCRSWNSQHSGGNSLNTFKLYFMQEWTHAPGQKQGEIQKLNLWNHECF